MKPRLIVPLVFVFAVSCAGLTPSPQTMQRIPDVAERFDGNVSQQIDRAIDALAQAITTAEQAEAAYQRISGLVPVNLDTQVRSGFRNLADLILHAVDALRKGVTTWAQYRALVQPVITATNHLSDWIRQLQPQQTNSWQPLVTDLIEMVAKAAIARMK